MKPVGLREFLQEVLGPSFECSVTHLEAVQVRTPFFYPDGDLIDVYIESQDSRFLVTDYGETWGQVQMQSFRDVFSWEQKRYGEKICKRWGIALNRGHLVVLVSNREHIRDAVHVLGQASTELAKTWLELAPMTRKEIAERSDKKHRGPGSDSGLGLDF